MGAMKNSIEKSTLHTTITSDKASKRANVEVKEKNKEESEREAIIADLELYVVEGMSWMLVLKESVCFIRVLINSLESQSGWITI